MLTPEQRMRQLRTFIQTQRYVQMAYVSGRIGATPSNVSVAVLLSSDESMWREQTSKLAEGLAWVFGVPHLDIVVLNKADPATSHRALYDGVLIHARDEAARIRFEKRVIRDYLDTGFLRRVHAGPAAGK